MMMTMTMIVSNEDSSSSRSRPMNSDGSSHNPAKSPGWEKLLHRKRQQEAPGTSPPPPTANDDDDDDDDDNGLSPGRQSPPQQPRRRCGGLVNTKSCSAIPDPLTAASAHRRSSFRKSALSPRSNQKNLLKVAAQAQLRRNQCAAAQIQALVRSFLLRKNFLVLTRASSSRKTTKKKNRSAGLLFQSNHTLRSMYSEVTMSDFDDLKDDDDDADSSIASLDWRLDLDETLHTVLKDHHHHVQPSSPRKMLMHASNSTPETWISTPQDSFSTLFSRESLDSPVRRPHRKLSPAPSPRSSRNSNMIINNNHHRFHSSAPSSSILEHSCSPVVVSPLTSMSPAASLRARRNQLLEAVGNMSLSTMMTTSSTTKDEPVQRPKRCHSPLRGKY